MEPNQQNKQADKTARDMEIKNKLIVTRGEGERGMMGKRRRVKSRNIYKGPMDKDKGGGEN